MKTMDHRDHPKLFMLFAMALLLSGCAATDVVEDDGWAAVISEFNSELKTDFPFHAGMTLEEVVKAFNDNNKTVHALMDEDFRKNRELGIFQPPLYADRNLHLYVYLDLFGDIKEANARTELITFLVNGRSQFWAHLQFVQRRVACIFITPGNMSVRGTPFLYDGHGDYQGIFADPQACH